MSILSFMQRSRELEKSPVKVVDIEEIDEAEYQNLAKRAGFVYGAHTVLKRHHAEQKVVVLCTFLAENGITVYDNLDVWKYMNRITPRGHEWYWCNVATYEKPIPAEVLMTMAKIVEGVSNEIMFEVTEIRRIERPDPFLRVSIRGSRTYFIIERWDEPTFRQSK